MSGLTRRELLKRSAVVAGAAWAAPMLSTGSAWAHPIVGDNHGGSACACGDGIIVYAKFAPGNAQTCQNQCLQPGTQVIRLPWDCLEKNNILKVCDNVRSNSDTASLSFFKGTRPMRVAVKVEGKCYAVRCNEGWHQAYRWTTSDNVEFFDAGHTYTDTQIDPADGIFRVYTGGVATPAEGPCTGVIQGAPPVPSGVHAGGSASSDHAFYGTVTGMAFSTEAISSANDKLNFIEFELCIPNASKLPCEQNMCKEETTTTTA